MAGGRLLAAFLVTAICVGAGGVVLAAGVLASAMPGSADPLAAGPVAGIPAGYLAAYRAAAARFELGADGWATSPPSARSRPTTVAERARRAQRPERPRLLRRPDADPQRLRHRRRHVGRVQGRRRRATAALDIYDPDDAIATAARYLAHRARRATGARRSFAYNHADWYVERVLDAAARYRAAAAPDRGRTYRTATGSRRAGFPGRALRPPDRRRRRRPRPHATASSSPTASAAGRTPSTASIRSGSPSTSARSTATGPAPSGSREPPAGCRPAPRPAAPAAARSAWSSTTATRGTATRAHSERPHLHLSWNHGPARPFSRAPWVQTLLSPGRTP